MLKTAAELAGKKDVESIREHLRASRYEEAAELLITSLEQRTFNDQMERYFSNNVLKGKALMGLWEGSCDKPS